MHHADLNLWGGKPCFIDMIFVNWNPSDKNCHFGYKDICETGKYSVLAKLQKN